jgi:large subunit ribosomal protein L21
MYAIIECGGKQYRVQEGDILKVEKITAEVGSTITIDKVLLLGGDKTTVGTPLVEGAKVTCKVMNQDKDKKILVFHYKAKKNIRKRYGHRQPFTSLLIEKIEKVKKAAKKAVAETTEVAENAETVDA